MADALERLRGAVASVAETAHTDTATASRLWMTYVRDHWTRDVPDLADLLRRLDLAEESPAHVACGLEFVMEGLHLTRRLNKDATLSGGTVYAG